MTENVTSRNEDGVFILSIARPEAKNAFSEAMYAGLAEAVLAAEADDSVRVIVLRGEGGNFSSGNDLKDFMENAPTGPESTVFRFMHAVADAKKPIVAIVEGFAVGIGATILSHADLVYAADNSKFVLPFVNLGLVPEAGSSYFLPRMAGHVKAAEFFFFGEPFNAETAREIGLVNEVLPVAEVEARAMARAKKLAGQPRGALLETKALLKRATQRDMLEHLDEEARVFCRLLREPDCIEAITAFFEKRKPNFAR